MEQRCGRAPAPPYQRATAPVGLRRFVQAATRVRRGADNGGETLTVRRLGAASHGTRVKTEDPDLHDPERRTPEHPPTAPPRPSPVAHVRPGPGRPEEHPTRPER